MATQIGTLLIEMSANVARLQKDMDDAKSVVGSAMGHVKDSVESAKKAIVGMGMGMAAAFTIDAFRSGINSAIDSMAELEKAAQKAGVSVESLSGLKSIAKLSGTGLDEAAAGLQKLAKAMDLAAEGGEKQRAAFAKLGVEYQNSDKTLRESSGTLLDVAKALDKMESGTQRVALAQEILGKSGANLLPFLMDMADIGELVGKTTTEMAAMAYAYEKQLVKLEARKKTLYMTIAKELLPVYVDFNDMLLKSSNLMMMANDKAKGLAEQNYLQEWARAGATAVAMMLDMFDGVGRVVMIIGKAIGALAAQMAALASGNFQGALAIAEAYDSERKAIWDNYTALKNTSALQDEFAKRDAGGKTVKGRPGNGDPVVNPDGNTTAQKISEYEKLTKVINEKLAAEQAEYEGGVALTESQKFALKIMTDLRDGTLKLTDSQKENVASLIDQYLTIDKANNAKKEQIKWAAEWRAAQGRETKSLADQIRKESDHIETLGLTKAQQDALAASKTDLLAIAKDEEAQTLTNAAAYAGPLRDAYIDAANAASAQAEQLRELANLKRQSAGKEIAVQQAKESTDAWKKFGDDIERALTDSLFRSFESGKGFGQTFVDSLKATLQSAALKLVIQYTVNGAGSIVGAAANALFGTSFGSGGSGGGGTDYGSLASIGSTAWNMYQGGTGGVAGYGVSALGSLTGNGTVQAYGAGMQMTATQAANAAALYTQAANAATTASTNLTLAATAAEAEGQVALATYLKSQAAEKVVEAGAMETTGTGLTSGSSAAGTVAWVAAIVMAMKMSSDAWKAGVRWDGTYDFTNDPIKGGPSGPHHERQNQVASAIFGKDFANSEFFATVSGNALSQLVHNMAWGGAITTGVPDMRGRFSESGNGFTNGQTGQEITEHGGWFTSTKRWWEWKDISPELDKQMDIMYLSISNALLSIGDLFSDNTMLDKIKSFSIDIRLASNDSTLTTVAEQLTEAMGNLFFPSVQALRHAASTDGKTAAESWSDALGRIITETQAVSRIFDLLGKSLVDSFGPNKADSILKASDNLVTLFGSVDNLNSSFGSYYSNFYTGSEQTAQAWKDMGKAFDLMGIAMPTTREGFRALVDGLDLTTLSGQITFKGLMDLQSGFSALTPAMDSASTAVEKLTITAQQMESATATLSKYLTPGQQRANSLAAIKSTAASNGVTLDDASMDNLSRATVADFATYVQAVSKDTTEAGKKMFVALAAIAPLFETLAKNSPAISALNTSIKSLQATADGIITTYGDVVSAMKEINPPVKTLVETWRDSKSKLAGLQSTFDAFFGTSVVNADKLLSTLTTQRAIFATGAQTADANAENMRVSAMTPEQRANFWKAKEGQLWAGLGNADDKGAEINKIMTAYSNRRTAELELLTSRQNALNDTTKTGLNDQLTTWQTTLSVIQRSKSLVKEIDQYIGSLAFGDLTALGYTDQLSAASSLYGTTLGGARAGDVDAMGNLTGNASAYLQEARDYYGAGTTDYANIYNQVVGEIGALGGSLTTDTTAAESEITTLTKAISGLTNTLPEDISRAFSNETADGYEAISDALTAGKNYTETKLAEQNGLLKTQITLLQAVIDGQQAQIAQQEGNHGQVLIELGQQTARLNTIESNGTLAVTAP
ncbi:MAG: hypothetical protein ABTQ26_00185 [Azonexus sp.]